jgi:hypothetical protein
MKWVILVSVLVLVLLLVAAGLYATGPKYVVTPHAKTRWQVLVMCFPPRAGNPYPYGFGGACGSRTEGWGVDATWDTEAEAKTYATKFEGPVPIARNVVWDIEPKTKKWTTIRRAAAWERVWYAVVGSDNTRS